MTEIKKEIDQLWQEHFKIVEKNKGCLDSPQKERAVSLMRKLLREGNEDRKWVREREVQIKWQAARVYQAVGKLSEAEELLEKAQRLLDQHPEIDQSLRDLVVNPRSDLLAIGAQPMAERNFFC